MRLNLAPTGIHVSRRYSSSILAMALVSFLVLIACVIAPSPPVSADVHSVRSAADAPGDYYSWGFEGYVRNASNTPLAGAYVAFYGAMNNTDLGDLLAAGNTQADGYFYYMTGSYTNYPYQNLTASAPAGYVITNATGGTGTSCSLVKKANWWLQNNDTTATTNCTGITFAAAVSTPTITPNFTSTRTATPTVTSTSTPTRTATRTPTRTLTSTATPTDEPVVYGWLFEGRVCGNEPGDIPCINPLNDVRVNLYGAMDASSQGTLLGTGLTVDGGYFSVSGDSTTNYPYQNLIETDPAGYISVGATGGSGPGCALFKINNNWLQNRDTSGDTYCDYIYFHDIPAPPTATRTATRTFTRTVTRTFTRSATATVTPTVTPTPTMANTPTVTSTPTLTPTLGPSPTPTATSTRTTRTIGVINITANTYTDLGGGQTRAGGQVVLNDNFYLSGSADQVTFGGGAMSGNGTLVMSQGQLSIFSGSFSVNTTTGILTPGSGSFNLSQLAGFSLSGAPTGVSINVPTGAVNGNAALTIAMTGVTGTATVSFAINPGPVYSGQVTALSITIAGVTISAPVSGTLTNAGLTATGFTLTGSTQFGSKTQAVTANLTITPSAITIGSGARFAFPELWYGGLSTVKLTGNQALLRSEAAGYYWDFSSTLSLALPGNSKTAALSSVTLRAGGLAGNAGNISLDVAGLTLQLNNVSMSSTALTPASATLTLPGGLGGGIVTLSNVSITKDGLVLTGTISLPDITFGGSGSSETFYGHLASIVPLGARPETAAPLTLRNNQASLTVQGNGYVLSVSTTADINLPGNAQTTTFTFTISKSGSSYQLSGTLSSLSLSLAGSNLSLQNVTLGNTGFSVSAATLTLPASLGNTSITVNDVSITSAGLRVGGGSITLPTIKFGDGTKLQIVSPTASIQAASGGYTFGVSGTLQVRLPQNSQDIAVSFTISTTGQFSGSISQLSLTLASTTLQMTDVTFNNSGLSVGQARLTLPASMGGASGWVNNITITKDGLKIGGGGVSFPFPDFTLGTASTGFSVTGASASLEIAADKTFKFTLSGTVAIQIPGGGASATGSITVNSQGQFSGSLSGFSLTVAGLSLDVTDAAISNSGTITIGSATLKTPAGFGGLSISVYNVSITKSGGVSIGGGAFNLPTIKAGGFEISASGSLIKVTNPNGYEITASGTLKMTQLGPAGGCSGISVSLTLFASTSGNTILLIRPEGEITPQAEIDALRNPLAVSPADWPTVDKVSGAAQAALAAQRTVTEEPVAVAESSGIDRGLLSYAAMRYVPDPQDYVEDPSLAPELSALKLRSISVSISCQLPIGQTGLYLTNIRGSITLSESTTTVSVGLTVSAGKKIGNVSVVSFDADATINTNPFKLAIVGTVKVFVFTAAGASAEVDSAGFKATIWFNLFVAHGQVTVQAWSSNGFHMTGSASITVGWKKGDIWQGCIPWVCCPNGKKYNGFNCWAWKTHKCDGVCISIPPWNMELGPVGADVGEFTNGKWGFKGYASMCVGDTCKSIGFYIDSSGTLKVGNVDSYRLVTRGDVTLARQQWQAAVARGEATGNDWKSPVGELTFLDSGDVLIPAPVTRTTDVFFSLARNGDAPTLSLITPSGVEITPDNTPANIGYQQVVTYAFGIRPETSQAAVSGLSESTLQALADRAARTDTVSTSCEFAAAAAGIIQSDQAMQAALASGTADPARVRFTNTSPDVPAVDVLANSSRIISNAAFGQTTDYTNLAPGVYLIQIVPAGATTPILAQATLTADIGNGYSLVGIGRQADMALLTMDDENGYTAEGRSLVRVVNASPSLPVLDLYINAGHGDASHTGDTPFINGVVYRNVSEYTDLQAGTYDIAVRPTLSSTIAYTATGVVLNESTIYSLYVAGLSSGQPALQVVAHADAVPGVQFRFAHGIAGLGAVDVLLDGTAVLTNSTPFSTTGYLPLDAGTYALKVTPAGATSPVYVNTSVDLSAGADYTFLTAGTAGSVQSSLLSDDTEVPAWERARVRFVHASANSPAVDVALAGQPKMFSNVAFKGSAGYQDINPGSYTVNVYRAGTTTLLSSVPVTLGKGEARTVFLMGQSGALQGVASLDMMGQPSILDMYVVANAQTGTWQLKLSGNPGPQDTYVVSAIGSDPAPGVSDVNAVTTTGNQAQVGWRITSDEPATIVSIYANPGAITTTQYITNSNGTTQTVVLPYFTGELLKTNVATPLDGTPFTTTVSLNQLTSGTYHVWVEADDGNNPPTRTYAPNPIVVSQSGSWPNTWTVSTVITPSYGALDLMWSAHPHPDVDGYIVQYGSTPLSMTDSITVSKLAQWTLESLNPGSTYYVKIAAYDDATGRTSTSQVVSAAAGVAPFAVALAPAAPTVIGGQQATTVITISTSMIPYPDAVGVYPAAGDGVRLIPTVSVVTPTLQGVAVPVVISTTNSAAGGLYTLPLLASGGGMSATVNVQVNVLQPGFALALAPESRTLGSGQAVQVVVNTTSVLGDNRPVSLALAGAPAGLQWRFSSVTVNPGVNATLTLSDTTLLQPGVHSLVITGDNGVQTVTRTLTLTVQKVSFEVDSQPATVVLQPGEQRTVLLDVSGLAGWTGPVTLTVHAATVPAGMTAGFVSGSTVVSEMVLATPGQAWLRISTGSGLPRQSYLLHLIAGSGDEEHTVDITVDADPNVISLPLISNAYTTSK